MTRPARPGFGRRTERGADPAPGYEIRPVPRHRQVVLDALVRSTRRFPMHGLVELDVERARSLITQSEARVTWTGFVVATMGRAVARHPEVNVRRAGHQLLCFDRVDIGATVERHADGDVVLDVVTIRDADRKSCAEITEELRLAKQVAPAARRPTGPAAWVTRLPGPLRRNAFRLAGTRPRVSATFGPAVGVSSIGMFARGWGWAIPVPPLTLIATVGGVVERPVVRDGGIVVRPLLPLTLSFDHGVIDGAPAARFVETLRDLGETAAALET